MKRPEDIASEIATTLRNREIAQASEISKRIAAQINERVRLSAEKEALIAKNEAKLRATGVVAIFEALRDTQAVTWSSFQKQTKIRQGLFQKETTRIETTTEPARVDFHGEYHEIISIDYNAYTTQDGSNSEWAPTGGYSETHYSSITAKFLNDGNLVINDEPITDGLENAIKNALL